MIPVTQTNTGGRGNCMAACFASILEISIDDVPDYRAIDAIGGSWINTFNTWLSKHYNVLYFELEHYFTGHITPAGYHLINLGNAEGGHSIVGHEGNPIWDPMGRFISHRKPVTPYSYGILVRVDTELRATWTPTWKECLCPRCIRGEG
jgi:hypothetical protein